MVGHRDITYAAALDKAQRLSPSDVTVNLHPGGEWTSSGTAGSLSSTGCSRPGPEPDEIARLAGVLSPNAAAGATPVKPPERRPGSVSRRITSEGVGRDG